PCQRGRPIDIHPMAVREQHWRLFPQPIPHSRHPSGLVVNGGRKRQHLSHSAELSTVSSTQLLEADSLSRSNRPAIRESSALRRSGTTTAPATTAITITTHKGTPNQEPEVTFIALVTKTD